MLELKQRGQRGNEREREKREEIRGRNEKREKVWVSVNPLVSNLTCDCTNVENRGLLESTLNFLNFNKRRLLVDPGACHSPAKRHAA